MKKFILFFSLVFILSFTSAEASRYSFNFGKIRITEAKLSRKNNKSRSFSGLIENRSSKKLTVTMDIYFKDSEVNNGREVLVASPTFYNLSPRSTKNFRTYLYVGEINGRDFRVKLSKTLEVK
ncbi:hypothetical protein [Ilyobacter polytropus]|uniref:Uncharacterized protein n=1 Tax=Ilyobacter polytropus (strain ATCC 51220 / DSM 2926 / LMG 16218 / CuHBu1) TaxID=572544 RepID=E3H661_ILYPC|nr:hypothetical protein [Ilyobacter polytropus]ADO81820.1 hypothetical protein Ilyop_0030 [Ilyobacter polytropus DSM 2926]